MKKICVLLFLLVFLGVFTYSSGQQEGKSESGKQEPVSITYWHGWTGADNAGIVNQMVKDFNQNNTLGIKVEVTPLPWDELFSKWVVSAASGNPPDVVMCHTSEVAQYASKGIMAPIDEMIDQLGIDLDRLPADPVAMSKYNGKFYAVPSDIHPLGLYYNKNMASEAGLDPSQPPTDKESFLNWAQKMTKDDQYGFVVPHSGAIPRWQWYSFLHQNKGKFFNDDKTEVMFNSPEGKEALQFIVDLIYKYEVAEKQVESSDEMFASNRVAMTTGGPWVVNMFLKQEDLTFGTAELPVIFDKPATWCNSHAMALSDTGDTTKMEAGMQFIKWFNENMLTAAINVGIIPINPKTLQQLREHERYEYYKAFDVDYVVSEPAIENYSDVFTFGRATPLVKNLEAALIQDKSVEQALNDMEKGVNQLLAEN